MEKEKKEPTGFLKGLRDFLKLLEEMEKKGETTRTSTGEVKGPGYSKISYDYSVKLGIGKEDFPCHSRRGFKLGKRRGRQVRFSEYGLKQREPLVDVFDKGSHILVVAELPNVKEEDITLEVADSILKIGAKTPRGRFERDIEVPRGSEIEKILKASFKNGILEIKLSKKGGDSNGG